MDCQRYIPKWTVSINDSHRYLLKGLPTLYCWYMISKFDKPFFSFFDPPPFTGNSHSCELMTWDTFFLDKWILPFPLFLSPHSLLTLSPLFLPSRSQTINHSSLSPFPGVKLHSVFRSEFRNLKWLTFNKKSPI